MEFKLKCCKRKDFNNLCCKTCLGVYHPSCMERYKAVKLLGNNIIYCSAECESKELDSKQNEDELLKLINRYKADLLEKDLAIEKLEDDNDKIRNAFENEISQLSNKIKEKNMFIKRLQRKTKDFEDEVFEDEKKSIEKINEQSDKINSLKKKIIELDSANKILSQEKDISYEELKKAKNDLQEIKELSQNMLVSIRTLEKDNEALSNEIRSLKERALPNTSKVFVKPRDEIIVEDDSTPEVISVSSESSKIPGKVIQKARQYVHTKGKHLLLFGDHSCRDWAVCFKKIPIMVDYEILGITKPYVDLKELTKTVFNCTKNYSESDCVIISLDLRSVKVINTSHLKELFSVAKFTNCIVTIKNNFFDSACFKIYDYISKFNKTNNTSIKIVENYRQGIYFRHNTRTLCNLLSNYVLNQKHIGVLKGIVTNVFVNEDDVTSFNDSCGSSVEISVPLVALSAEELSLPDINNSVQSTSVTEGNSPLPEIFSNMEVNVTESHFLVDLQPPLMIS